MARSRRGRETAAALTNCGLLPTTVRKRGTPGTTPHKHMAMLVDNIRGTLAGVIGAADHLAWYVDWQTGNRRCARTGRREAHAALVDRR